MSKTLEKYLTTRQLARLWLVSEATVKRWADAGLLPASRTAGGHRRFLPEEVARFQTARGLGRAAPAAETATAGATTRARAGAGVGLLRAGHAAAAAEPRPFFDAIIAGRDDEATSLLLEAYLDGVEMWRIFDETVAGAMRRVGDLWHRGDVTVAGEHFATRTATRAVERLGVSVRRREGSGRSAVCCAPEGELHELPVLGLQVLLESEGWRVRGLGANTPFFTLADAVERHRPDLVCVSATMPPDPERSARDYAHFAEAAARAGARVALGGQGFRDEGAGRRFDADFRGDSFEGLMTYVGGVK